MCRAALAGSPHSPQHGRNALLMSHWVAENSGQPPPECMQGDAPFLGGLGLETMREQVHARAAHTIIFVHELNLKNQGYPQEAFIPFPSPSSTEKPLDLSIMKVFPSVDDSTALCTHPSHCMTCVGITACAGEGAEQCSCRCHSTRAAGWAHRGAAERCNVLLHFPMTDSPASSRKHIF